MEKQNTASEVAIRDSISHDSIVTERDSDEQPSIVRKVVAGHTIGQSVARHLAQQQPINEGIMVAIHRSTSHEVKSLKRENALQTTNQTKKPASGFSFAFGICTFVTFVLAVGLARDGPISHRVGRSYERFIQPCLDDVIYFAARLIFPNTFLRILSKHSGPLSLNEIYTLLRICRVYSAKKAASSFTMCNICLEDYFQGDEEEIAVLPCRHAFHRNCVFEWLCRNGVHCPICLHDLQSDVARCYLEDQCF